MDRRTRLSLRLIAGLALVALTAAATSTASAHAMPGLDVSKAPPVRTPVDRQDVASLGAEHAAEHRWIRAEQRWIRHLSKRQLKRLMASNLRVYKGAAHPHEAQTPEALDIAGMNRKNAVNKNARSNQMGAA